jgi:hypothetical protein
MPLSKTGKKSQISENVSRNKFPLLGCKRTSRKHVVTEKILNETDRKMEIYP